MEDEIQCLVCAQVLMDPMTLCCGHSFCRLCLARLWINQSKRIQSVGQLLCPACRQPWVQMPKINIQLKNITENIDKEGIMRRKRDLTDIEKKLIKLFSSLDEGPAFNVIIGWMFFLCLALGVCVVLFGLVIALIPAEPKGEFLRKPVALWKSQDVLEWMEGHSSEWATPNITRLFQIQALTGSQLLMVVNHTLIDFGIEQHSERQAILNAVEQLKIQEYSQPLDFYQFKAAHRRTTLLLVLLYPVCPQFTIVYSYWFEYCTIYVPLSRAQFFDLLPPEGELNLVGEIVSIGFVIFFPHLGVCVLCFKWLYIHPLLCLPVLMHCFIRTFVSFQQMLKVFKTLVSQIRSKLLFAGGQLLFSALLVGVYHLVWSFVPYFICDLLFYISLWWTLIWYLVVNPLNKHFKH